MSEEKPEGAITALNTVLDKALDKDNLDKLLKDWDRYNKIFDRVNETINKLDKIGLLPAIVRAVGKKYDIPDIEQPLHNPLNIIAQSPIHKLLFEEMNQIPEPQIKEMYNQALTQKLKAEAESGKMSKQKPKQKDEESTN